MPFNGKENKLIARGLLYGFFGFGTFFIVTGNPS
jgi:hypothetical protein